MGKRAVQQDCSERRGEAYLGLYGESLGDVKATLVGFFTILAGRNVWGR